MQAELTARESHPNGGTPWAPTTGWEQGGEHTHQATLILCGDDRSGRHESPIGRVDPPGH